jgi:hypothetical protein
LTQAEIQALLRNFAAPLADYASTSHIRHQGADFMVRTLWQALIAGQEMEEETWKAFREIGGIEGEDLKAIQDCYYQKMKPLVTEEQLVALRRRYGLKRKHA